MVPESEDNQMRGAVKSQQTKKCPTEQAQPISQTSKSTPRQTISWHDIPEEIRVMIYTYYFAINTYTIHDTKYWPDDDTALSNTIVPPNPCKSPIHHFYAWPLNTGNASHVNLFLIHPLIMHTAHPIFLTNSTFIFAPCITSNRPSMRYGRSPLLMSAADLRRQQTHRRRTSLVSILINLPIPKQWLCSLRRVQCELDTALTTMNVLEFLARRTKRSELSNFVRKKDQQGKREGNNRDAKSKARKITLFLKARDITWAGILLREEQFDGRCLDLSLEHIC